MAYRGTTKPGGIFFYRIDFNDFSFLYFHCLLCYYYNRCLHQFYNLIITTAKVYIGKLLDVKQKEKFLYIQDYCLLVPYSAASSSNAFRCLTMVFMFVCAHSVSCAISGTSERPISVRRYSTLGGTVGYTFLATRASASNVLSVPDSTREETSGIRRHSSLKRTHSCSLITNTTNNAHLLPKRAITFRTGQISIIEFFFFLFQHSL